MKILERKGLSVVGFCPHCGSKLELEKGDVWWHKGKTPCVTCIVCGNGFNVENWTNINEVL